MSASATVFSLPIPLILLIHLHILEYPHANKPEYDPNLFEPRVRGLKERTKSLEDISYFLVGRLEGTASAKTILTTYPCVAPPDTLAFRTSVSKYLETLRHNSVFPSSSLKATTNTAPGSKLKGKESTKTKAPSNPNSNAVAWWWKDVVVRKSLLEECAGERFERLLLSLSTHALLKGSSKLSAQIDLEHLNTTLRSQPTTYNDLLTKSKASRHSWAYSASLLLHREAELHFVRDRLRSPSQSGETKYTTFPTNRLHSLVRSKHEDLLRTSWEGPNGRRALEFLINAAGIVVIHDELEAEAEEKADILQSNLRVNHSSAPPQGQPQPLPIAAAHHPAYLKKIRKPILPTTSSANALAKSQSQPQPQPQSIISAPTPAPLALSDRREAEAQTHKALIEALAKIKKVGRELAERAKVLDAKRGVKPNRRNIGNNSKHIKKKEDAALKLDLWHPEPIVSVDFETTPTPALLASLNLNISLPDAELGLEARIDEIRGTLLPPYPALPDLSAPRLPFPHSDVEPKKASSKIPRVGQGQVGATKSKPRLGDKEQKSKVDDDYKTNPNPQPHPKPKVRKSIRASLTLQAQRRPSLFAPPHPSHLDPSNPSSDTELDEIIHSVQDTSTVIDIDAAMDFTDGAPTHLYPTTRNTKTPGTVQVHRIFTGTKTRGGSTVHRPSKESFPACAQCGYPAAKLRSFEWGQKAKRRKTTGTGRMRYLKDVSRRFKNGFRENTTATKRVKKTTEA
ncbi:hypothetical protein C0991_006653 [Blastosporella zonata]|nr:hypothetical protein C0991_006653 [Blastosporella zonata]